MGCGRGGRRGRCSVGRRRRGKASSRPGAHGRDKEWCPWPGATVGVGACCLQEHLEEPCWCGGRAGLARPPYRGPLAAGASGRCRSAAHRLEQDGPPCRGSRLAQRRVAQMALRRVSRLSHDLTGGPPGDRQLQAPSPPCSTTTRCGQQIAPPSRSGVAWRCCFPASIFRQRQTRRSSHQARGSVKSISETHFRKR